METQIFKIPENLIPKHLRKDNFPMKVYMPSSPSALQDWICSGVRPHTIDTAQWLINNGAPYGQVVTLIIE